MMTPQNADGAQQSSRVKRLLAQKLLEQALPAYGSGKKEGKAILDAITKLAKAFGKNESETEELAPAEKMQLVQDLAGPGEPPKGPPPGGPGPQPLTGGAPPPPPPGA
jgi:predicted house-cleaning noncanonical NTP pyrophosphatase (MazG superfamily)